MKLSPVPKYFVPEEYLPQGAFDNLKRSGKLEWLWPMLFDPRVIITNDRLRERYGPMIINNWKWGGRLQYRGWRPPNSGVGSEYSQHLFGRATDSHFRDISVDEVRDDIKRHPYDKDFEYITRIEEFPGMSWFHYDVASLAGLPLAILRDGIWWIKG